MNILTAPPPFRIWRIGPKSPFIGRNSLAHPAFEAVCYYYFVKLVPSNYPEPIFLGLGLPSATPW